jgi:hypothetical protein
LSGRRRHIAFADAEDDRRVDLCVDRLRDRYRTEEGI